MKIKISLLLIVVAAIFALCGCDLEGADKRLNDPIVPDKTDDVVTKNYYSVKFLQDGEVLGSSENIEEGTLISQPTLTMEDNVEYTYEFIGWDANNDGLPETFPYELNANTTFNLLYTATPVMYHYEIYVKDQLVKEADVKYGEYYEYPEVGNSIDGDNVYFFLGWKYDGVFDGLTYLQVTKNVRIDAYFADSQILKMYYNGMMYAKYIQQGEILTYLSDWGIQSPEEMQIKWYTDSNYEIPFDSSKMPQGNLSLYGRAEEIIVYTDDEINVGSKEEVLDEFNEMIINRKTEAKFRLGFTIDSIDDFLAYIVNESLQLYNYQVNASKKNTLLSLSITYEPINTTKSDEVLYTQINSYNYKGSKGNRSEEYDSFKVNDIEETYEVCTSDALFYALEHGYKPVIDESNQDLVILYEIMKSVLRKIVNDDMTDVEKAQAIYEYLVLETTYDGKVLELSKSGANGVSQYRSFYLEGVFIDHLAVCDGLSKAYSALCSMEGIKCVRVTGLTIDDVSHAWNKIYIDGKWYIVDVTSGGCVTDSVEVLTYSYFMITTEKFKEYATEDGIYYPEYIADTMYDVYSTLGVKAQDIEGAADLFKEFYENAPLGKSSFDIGLGFEYTSVADVVEKILEKAEYSGKVSYVNGFNNNIIIILTK